MCAIVQECETIKKYDLLDQIRQTLNSINRKVLCFFFFYQVKVFILGEQFDVGTSTVDSILEVHLVPVQHHHNSSGYVSRAICATLT